MSFVDKKWLQKLLGKSMVASYIANFPDELDTAILEADKIITGHAKIQPPSDADNASPELRRYAAWIVNYMLTDNVSGLTEKSYEQRLDKYKQAIAALKAYEGNEITSETVAVSVTTTSTTRLETFE